jgi:hypothetical protein
VREPSKLGVGLTQLGYQFGSQLVTSTFGRMRVLEALEAQGQQQRVRDRARLARRLGWRRTCQHT